MTSEIAAPPHEMPAQGNYRSWIVHLSVAALILCGTIYSYYPPPQYFRHSLCGQGIESLQLACSLKDNGSFSDPFQVMATGPSAHLAPLFPAFVAGIMKYLGTDRMAELALAWAGIFVTAFVLVLLPFLTKRMALGFGAGAIAATAIALARLPTYSLWESIYTALFGVVLSALMYDIVAGRASTTRSITTAALWGILLWVSAVPLLVLLAWLCWLLLGGKLTRTQKLVLLILPFLIISPWIVRNYRVFGHFIFMRDNLGLELAISNNSCAAFWFKANESSQCFGENHPNKSLAEAEQVRRLGEYEYNRNRLREALEWIRSNPAEFASLTGRRFVAFWFWSPTGNPLRDTNIRPGILLVWFATLLSLPGLWLMWQRNRNAASIFLLWLGLFPPIYYLIQFDPRYRYPILWATFLPAGFFIAEVAKGVWQAFRPASGFAKKKAAI